MQNAGNIGIPTGAHNGVAEATLPLTSYSMASIQRDAYRVAKATYEAAIIVLQWAQDVLYTAVKSLHFWMQRSVATIALPAISRFTRTELCYLKQAIDKDIASLPTTIKAERVVLDCDEKYKLSGVKIMGAANPSTKWIVYFQPNVAAWEANFIHLLELHKATSANIITYNYPEVGFSGGEVHTEADVLEAADHIMRSLLIRDGIPAEDIIVHGFSIGGLVASIMVEKLAKEGHTLALCNERSTLSVPKMLHALAYCAYLFSWVFVVYNWTLNAERSLINLKPNIKVLFITNPSDGLMVPTAQAVDAKGRMKAEVETFEMGSSDDPDVSEHARPWFDHEYTEYAKWAKKTLRIESTT